MRRMRFAIFAAILGFCSTAEIAFADDAADAWKALRAGGHVALMRHADAPGGAGDPPGFRVDDCATQRNLSEKGRADAAKIGVRLKQEGIAFEKILSSPWCRCKDTATLLNLGPSKRKRPLAMWSCCAIRGKGSPEVPARSSPNGRGHQTCLS